MTNAKSWTQPNGKKIVLKRMTNDHLRHALKFLERRLDEEDPVPIPYFLDGMAKYFGESDWDVLMKQRADDLWPVFDDLLEEADRRELAVD